MTQARRRFLGAAGLMAPLSAFSGSVSASSSTSFVSVWDHMSEEERRDANNPAGPSNDAHSDSFRRALIALVQNGARCLYVPPVRGAYSVGDVDLPPGVSLVGAREILYNPISVAQVLGKGSVVLQAGGRRSMFRWQSGSSIEGLILHGNGKQTDCFSSLSGMISQTHVVHCGIYGFRYGIGNPAYMSTVRAFRCNIAQNTRGVFALRDSQLLGNFINANDEQGIDLPIGANDVQITGNKIEWNKAEGLRFTASVNCLVGENIIDRNGRAGIRVGDRSHVLVGSNFMRRNGRVIPGDPECAHIFASGAGTTLTLGPIASRSGQDDRSVGTITPNYTLSLDERMPIDSLTWTGGDARGCVSTSMKGPIPATCLIRGVNGVTDLVNTGPVKTEAGLTYCARGTWARIAPGTKTSPLQVVMASQTSHTFMKVRVDAAAPSGASIGGEVVILVRRSGARTWAHFLHVAVQAAVSHNGTVTTGTSHLGVTATDTIQLEFVDMTSDVASTFAVTAVNNDRQQPYAITITVTA